MARWNLWWRAYWAAGGANRAQRHRIKEGISKGNKERIVPFGEPAARAIQIYLEQARQQLAARSKSPQSSELHLFLGNRGAEMRVVQEMLGHQNLAGTQVNTNVSTERLAEIFKQAHPRS